MFYLINLFIILFSLIPSSTLYAKNPFSINFESEPLKLQGEVKQTIKLSIKSNNIEDAKYYLKLNIPKTHMVVLEGRDLYTGELAPLKSKDYYVTVRLKKEGEGKITGIIYPYIDDRDVDTSNPNKFTADYSISKSTKTVGKDYLLSVASTNEETSGNFIVVSEDEDLPYNKTVANKEEGQRFVLGSKNRDNSFLRSILFVLSFSLVAWFAYRIINK
jgi:hypothetical protein